MDVWITWFQSGFLTIKDHRSIPAIWSSISQRFIKDLVLCIQLLFSLQVLNKETCTDESGMLVAYLDDGITVTLYLWVCQKVGERVRSGETAYGFYYVCENSHGRNF